MDNPIIPGVKRFMLARVPVDILSPEELVIAVQKMAEDGGQHKIVLLTYSLFRKIRRNEELSKFIQQASLVIPVHASISWGMQFVGLPTPVLYHPFDFVIRLLGALEEKGRSAYFFGGRHGEIQEIAGVMKSSFPNLRLVGRHVGFCSKEQEEVVVTAIQKAGPTVLVTGTGIHGREKWLFRNAERFTLPISLWSAEAFLIMSGKKLRPSRESAQKGTWALAGLAWQPWRWLRALSYIGYFFILVVRRIKKET